MILVCDFEIVLHGPRPSQPYSDEDATWHTRYIEDVLEVLREHGMGVVMGKPVYRWADSSKKLYATTATLVVRHAIPTRDVGGQRLKDELPAHGSRGEQDPRPIAARITRAAWNTLSYTRLKAMTLTPFNKAPPNVKTLVERALIGRE